MMKDSFDRAMKKRRELVIKIQLPNMEEGEEEAKDSAETGMKGKGLKPDMHKEQE